LGKPDPRGAIKPQPSFVSPLPKGIGELYSNPFLEVSDNQATLWRAPQEIIQENFAYACLTQDMIITNVTLNLNNKVFLDGTALVGQSLYNIVSSEDRDTISRLQRTLEEERRGREPSYLPPMEDPSDTIKALTSVELGQPLLSRVAFNHNVLLTFCPKGKSDHKTFDVKFALGKENSRYFILLWVPAKEPLENSRESQFGYRYRHPPQVYAPSRPPIYVPSPYTDPREMAAYGAPGALSQNHRNAMGA
jgi:hypothetical protein